MRQTRIVVLIAVMFALGLAQLAMADSSTGYSNVFTIDNRATNAPAAYNVRSPQGNYFIPGMPGSLTFTADISWNGSAGSVNFNLNGGSYPAAITDLGGGNASAQVTIPAPTSIAQASQVTVEVTNAAGNSTVTNAGL